MKRLFYTLPLLMVSAAGLAASFNFNGLIINVPEGFTIEQVAAPPLVNRPISIAHDDLGRLYVTDSAGATEKAPEQLKTRPHRIVRLEDVDGDGRFDKSTVFADKMMFPEGAMFYEGSLYVAAPPEIWKLTDTDDDGVADKRDVWFDGRTLTGCANDLHGPYLGRDGWFYWCKGAFAEQKYTLPDGREWSTRASHIFRARPDGTGIEPVMTGGMDNPVDVAFTASGERILSTTFFQQPADGLRDGLIHAIYGGVYGKQHDVLKGHPRTGDLMPVLVHMGAAAPCGLITYDSRVFGDDYEDNLFACYFNLHKVTRHVLVPEGGTFKTRDVDFVTSEHPDFHPTDVLEDADGSLLVVDTGGWYKICCPSSQLWKPDVLGAVYRVRKTGGTATSDPRGLKLNWTAANPAELAARLADKRVFVQRRAMHELGKLGEKALPVLAPVIFSSRSIEARRNAVWTLARIGGTGACEQVRTAMNDTDPGIALAAIHVASLLRDRQSAGRLQGFLDGSSEPHKRAAAEALGRIGGKSSMPALLQAAGQPASRVTEHSLIYAMIETGDATGIREIMGRALRNAGLIEEEVQPDQTHPFIQVTARSVRAGLIALDQMPDGRPPASWIIPLLSHDLPELRSAAEWIVGHHPEWSPELSGWLRKRLQSLTPAEDQRAGLRTQMAALASDKAMQEFMANVLGDPTLPAHSHRLILEAMAQASTGQAPVSWEKGLKRCLATGDEETLRATVATIRALPAGKNSSMDFSDALQSVANNGELPPQLRVDALAAITGGLREVNEGLFAFLTQQLAAEDPLLRLAAAGVLARARLSDAQLMSLTASMRDAGPMELATLLEAFARTKNEQVGLKLVASLGGARNFNSLRPDMIQTCLAKYPAHVQGEADALIKRLDAEAASQKARLHELAASLPAGDIRRGQSVFLSPRAACSTCHAIGYQGGRLGPDLTRLGKVRTEVDFLESIVFPSRTFVRSYEPVMILARDGETYTGIIKNETADSVHIVTGPNAEQRIPRSQIAEMRPGQLSIMPAGLDQQLSLQELADLVAFLKSQQ